MPTTRSGQPDIPRRSVLTDEPLPPAHVIARARRRNDDRARDEHRRLLGDTLTAAEIAARLDVSVAEVEALVRDRRLFAIEVLGELRFPAWQLVLADDDGVAEALKPALEALPLALSGVSLARWFETPKDHLNGDTPAAWLRRGEPSELVIEAAAASGTY